MRMFDVHGAPAAYSFTFLVWSGGSGNGILPETLNKIKVQGNSKADNVGVLAP